MKKGLREGWTTGTCSAAAAKAAALALVRGEAVPVVEVGLPRGDRVCFAVERTALAEGWAESVVVKDAGDDPDCTHGAHMTVRVSWSDAFELTGGEGVGTVTLPGLGLEIETSAINPVPRRQITRAVKEAVGERPVRVVVSVPGGEEMATHTTNDRLGILGGISILGTTGIVKPFSTASYRASIAQAVDVVKALGGDEVILATGNRSENAARRLYPDRLPAAYIEIGDFTGFTLRHAAKEAMSHAALVAMVGKLSKISRGIMQTYFKASRVEAEHLSELAAEAGAPPALVASARTAVSARHFFEMCEAAGHLGALELICRRAKQACESHVRGELPVDVVMVDFDGDRVIARA